MSGRDRSDSTVVESETAQPRRRQLVVMGRDVLANHPLPDRGTVTVGRSGEADVRLDNPLASRSHLVLHLGERIELEDVGSANGTRLRDARLQAGQRVELKIGETFYVGSTILVVRAGAPGAPPPRVSPWEPSAPMRGVYELAERAAAGSIHIVILGETGVGKELLAEHIHARSPRAERPFLRLSCASLSEALLESELFGHERGALPGAAAKPGLLEVTDGGTVFLDEIGELPGATQVKLLRVIEAQKVQRVGGTRPRAIDVRFIAASHRDLEAEVARGGFRADLWFRLNGLTLRVPPLRERAPEIESLARAFLAEGCRQARRVPVPAISEEALHALERHPWPGNVRELRNVIERALLLAPGGTLEARHLALGPVRAPASRAAETLSGEVEDGPPGVDERERILDALRRCAGNQSRAARLLGMSRRTLINRLASYDIPRPRKSR